jgi:hypothetical protein
MLAILIEYVLDSKIRNERLTEIMDFILHFKSNRVIKFVINTIQHNTSIYQHYEKRIIKYIQTNWRDIRDHIIEICLESIDHIKLIYMLIKKL